MNQSLINLRESSKIHYNAQDMVVNRLDVEEALDYIKRLENLVTVQNVLIDKAELTITCNDCPFIRGCIFEEGKVSDCQIRMANQGRELNYVL